ncbi:MAG: YceI family protein, partial [Flavisolibacter sp.]
MKNIQSFYLAAIFLFLFTACTDAPESDEAKTSDAKAVSDSAVGETLVVDTTASKIEWVATKVSGYHTGTIHIKNGVLQSTGGNITGGNFTMDMNSIVVSGPKGSDPKGNAKLLGHLKSPDFFEVDKNP